MTHVVSEFGAETENAALKRAIAGRIKREGAISFRDFMDAALYHPGLGYYTSDREQIGRDGDFLTSPEVSPVFGAMAGRQLREMWEGMGRPPRFDLAEAGPGSGALARDVLAWAQRTAPDFAQSLAVTLVEVSEPLQERQRRLLASEGLADNVRWAPELPRGVTGVILANELLDALPVHRVVQRDNQLFEVFVGWDGGHLTEELRPARPEIEAYFERLGLRPGEGCTAEVNLAALEWMRTAAQALERGYLLLFDYGYEAAELYAPWRRDGTLLCFYGHNPGTDPFARIGRQDMTAHVDWTSVRAAGEAAGLETAGLTTQSEFLERLGIAEAMAAPQEGAGMEEFYARRKAAVQLMDPGGLGRIKVLAQSRGAPLDLCGFRDGAP